MEEEEKKKSNFLKTFLIILATFVLTVIIVLGSLAYYVASRNPFNVQACLISSFLNSSSMIADNASDTAGTAANSAASAGEDFDHPLLSTEQETMLETAGIDVSSLPTAISAEMEACFTATLGEDRVKEIMGGGTLGPLDIFRAKSCL